MVVSLCAGCLLLSCISMIILPMVQVIELDKDLYGPDNHLVEWHRTPTTQETDGFQVERNALWLMDSVIALLLNHIAISVIIFTHC